MRSFVLASLALSGGVLVALSGIPAAHASQSFPFAEPSAASGATNLRRDKFRHGRRHGGRHEFVAVPLWGEVYRTQRRASRSPPRKTGFTIVVEAENPLRLHPYAWGWVSSCEARYATFDAQTGTFVENGETQRCE